MMLYEMSDRERQILYNVTYRWNLQSKTDGMNQNLHNKTGTHS